MAKKKKRGKKINFPKFEDLNKKKLNKLEKKIDKAVIKQKRKKLFKKIKKKIKPAKKHVLKTPKAPKDNKEFLKKFAKKPSKKKNVLKGIRRKMAAKEKRALKKEKKHLHKEFKKVKKELIKKNKEIKKRQKQKSFVAKVFGLKKEEKAKKKVQKRYGRALTEELNDQIKLHRIKPKKLVKPKKGFIAGLKTAFNNKPKAIPEKKPVKPNGNGDYKKKLQTLKMQIKEKREEEKALLKVFNKKKKKQIKPAPQPKKESFLHKLGLTKSKKEKSLEQKRKEKFLKEKKFVSLRKQKQKSKEEQKKEMEKANEEYEIEVRKIREDLNKKFAGFMQQKKRVSRTKPIKKILPEKSQPQIIKSEDTIELENQIKSLQHEDQIKDEIYKTLEFLSTAVVHKEYGNAKKIYARLNKLYSMLSEKGKEQIKPLIIKIFGKLNQNMN
ncbi:MAG: hypothetical protein U9Q69_01585 [Nanoarchaeota archaeon]|nr:hypothetical protein [Nanoarchaeota archaeon]